MSNQVVLKSFAELALAFRLETLSHEPAPTCPRPATEAGETEPPMDLDRLMRDLEAAEADLQRAVHEDETTRAEALQELERYDGFVASLRQAEAARDRAAQMRADAERLAQVAFTDAARESASRAVETADRAAHLATVLVEERQAAVEKMASRLDLARLLAERQRHEDQARQEAEAGARQEWARELAAAVQQALVNGRLNEALTLLDNAQGVESTELTQLRSQVTERIRIGRTWAAEQALRLARRTHRHDPAQAVHTLEAVVVDLLPDTLARQVFGEWARACLRLCRQQGIQAPLRYAPELGRGAVLAWDEARQAYVVVSALGMGPAWATGQRVDDTLAQRARPLT